MHRHKISFKHAFDGIAHAFTHQPNLRIHCLFGSLAIILGLFYSISSLEWLIILFTILWVILSEMINTAMEAIVDLITEERRQNAKIAKDVAAGAVLIGAVGSIIVGLVIFVPYILQ